MMVKQSPLPEKVSCLTLDLGVEPQKQRDNDVGLLVNLLATQEDHLEVSSPQAGYSETDTHLIQTSTQKDATMQAGKQKGALPLIRKFNEHSERLLNAAEFVKFLNCIYSRL